MAIQTINLGTYANDGTGDDLRTAFEKVRANFIELYSTVFGANVGENPPISGVEQGELWWSTVEGKLYIYYGTAWIDATPVPAQILYDISATAATGGANIHLNGSNSDSDDVKIASSTNITVTRTDANTITLSSTSYTGNVTGNLTGNVTGNLTGDVTGNVTGNLTGDVTGNVTGNLTGNVTGSVSGNAGSVTNGVYTNGSYENPTWITSLAGSKVSGNISGNAGTVTNGVYTAGDQTIGGTKTFSNTISGSITGNAGTVTNGVYTTSSVNALADVDTATAIPTIGQALVWDGTNWVPGSVAGINNFNFGGFNKVFTDPISYLLDKTGIDMGTFALPAEESVDLGTF